MIVLNNLNVNRRLLPELIAFAKLIVSLLRRVLILRVRVIILVVLNMIHIVPIEEVLTSYSKHLPIIVVHTYNHLFNYYFNAANI